MIIFCNAFYWSKEKKRVAVRNFTLMKKAKKIKRRKTNEWNVHVFQEPFTPKSDHEIASKHKKKRRAFRSINCHVNSSSDPDIDQENICELSKQLEFCINNFADDEDM